MNHLYFPLEIGWVTFSLVQTVAIPSLDFESLRLPQAAAAD